MKPLTLHVPVLLQEAVDYWAGNPQGYYVDLTTGAGGHSWSLLSLLPQARCLCVDWNERSLALAQERLKFFHDRTRFVRANFRNLDHVLTRAAWPSVDGILCDLGPSTFQVLDSGLGLSYQNDEPLDMRLDSQNKGITAAELLAALSEGDLEQLLMANGEISRSWSRRIAHTLCNAGGSIKTSGALVKFLRRASGNRKIWAQVFQALRIVVNDELGAIRQMLGFVPAVLKPGGRVVVISFHSLEDRIVKDVFHSWVESGQARFLSRSTVQACERELEQNPKARSARLRAIEKIDEPRNGE
ncbi:MAG: 16S rRNA (cytosine(1402)-N(4))-methyltransferase RsmH [Elusimicrobia bacterium]|nr:16S rRNA (cytosine(1402)-N(4))-methyltransferase RsmH [Elusimicrobiota bacterium]